MPTQTGLRESTSTLDYSDKLSKKFAKSFVKQCHVFEKDRKLSRLLNIIRAARAVILS